MSIFLSFIRTQILFHLHKVNEINIRELVLYLGPIYGFVHYDPLMMSQKEAPTKHPWVLPRKVAYLV